MTVGPSKRLWAARRFYCLFQPKPGDRQVGPRTPSKSFLCPFRCKSSTQNCFLKDLRAIFMKNKHSGINLALSSSPCEMIRPNFSGVLLLLTPLPSVIKAGLVSSPDKCQLTNQEPSHTDNPPRLTYALKRLQAVSWIGFSSRWTISL